VNDIICYKNIDNIDSIDYVDRLKKWCNYYGLDYSSISNLVKKFYNLSIISKIINKWVIENNDYIPEITPNISSIPNKIQYIYISTYSDLNNIEDTKDIKSVKYDTYSMVKSEYIHHIKKEKDNINIVASQLSYFNYSEHSSAIIPSLFYYLDRKLLPQNIVFLLYKNIKPSMLEKYILPEKDKNTNKKYNNNIAYNQQLLMLFELLRTYK